jgi:ribosome recycling factor
MSEQDVENLEDSAIGKCIRLKRNLAAVQMIAAEKAEEMRALANHLTKNPEMITVQSYDWLQADSIQAVVSDIKRAQAELAEANDAARALGVTIPQ